MASLGKTAGGAPIVVDVAAAKGEHYLAVTSRVELATDKITLSRSGPRGNWTDPVTYFPLPAPHSTRG